jgi:Flp pilus assembly pilin Flp
VDQEGGFMIEHHQWVRDEKGQTMAEYAVVMSVITLAIVVTVGLLSTAIGAELTSVIGIL